MCLGFLTSFAARPTSGEISVNIPKMLSGNPMILPTAVNPINPGLGQGFPRCVRQLACPFWQCVQDIPGCHWVRLKIAKGKCQRRCNGSVVVL